MEAILAFAMDVLHHDHGLAFRNDAHINFLEYVIRAAKLQVKFQSHIGEIRGIVIHAFSFKDAHGMNTFRPVTKVLDPIVERGLLLW